MAEYLKSRRFRFLHHYAGVRDPMGKALREECDRRGLTVDAISVDYERDGTDLLQKQPYEDHLSRARRGGYDGFHTGWPCTSFSRLRWRKQAGYPGPVRSRRDPYGLKDNTEKQQQEADCGTLHASRSALMVKAMIEGHRGAKVQPVVTMENPPPSDHPDHLSAWELYEVAEVVEEDLGVVDFDTCVYEGQLEDGRRHLKPQRFAGTLQNLIELEGKCECRRAHEPIVGKEKSRASAEYPSALCRKYAKLACDQFERIGKAEYLLRRTESLKQEVEELRAATDQKRGLLAKSKGGPKADTGRAPGPTQEGRQGVKRKGPDMWWRLDNREKAGGV